MADNLKELEKFLADMGKNPSQELAEKLMGKLEASSVFVPAIMPKDTPPEILKSMLEKPDRHAPIPEGANPQPGILQNDKGEHFIAVYTTEKEWEKSGNKNAFPLIINIPFENCMNMAVQNKDGIDGIVINPFSHNVIMRTDGKEKEQEKLEGPLLHAAIRRRLETADLPKSLFDGGGTAVESLKDNGAKYILGMYGELYGDSREDCPYDESDFDFMTLGISETLLLTRIAMPEKCNYPGTCRAVFAAWNPENKELSYYTIERKSQVGGWIIVRVKKDGSLSVVGDAPDEGVELQCIIDLAQEDRQKP